MILTFALSLICVIFFGWLGFFKKELSFLPKDKKLIKSMLFKLVSCFSGLVFLITMPFIIEQIILCETIFPFNLPIEFDKDIWFGFVSSYIGTIGTVALGGLALWQNKRYKELSDISSKKMDSVLSQIKETIWRNNIPILNFISNEILQKNIETGVFNLSENWKLAKPDGTLHFRFINSDIEQMGCNLCLLRKYEFQFKNLSNFPIQTISPKKLSIRKSDNHYIKYNVQSEFLAGYIDAHSNINCSIEIYDLIENLHQYNNNLLEIQLTVMVTDSKGYKHDKFFQLIGNNPIRLNDKQINWSNVIILSTKVEQI